jgi:hypothetical protein
MRFARFGLLPFFFLFNISVWAQQPASSQQAASAQPASDPQAVAVVQAAITALGGAVAIGQAQSWTFQGRMFGAFGNENVSYAISTDADTGTLVFPDGTTKPAPKPQSYFLPALAASILLRQFQDPAFTMRSGGTTTMDSKPVTIVIFDFQAGTVQFPAQVWVFDASNLPVRVDFRLPTEIGAKRSIHGTVLLSDFHLVSGVLYPFTMVEMLPAAPTEVVTIHSVSSTVSAPKNEANAMGGDSR